MDAIKLNFDDLFELFIHDLLKSINEILFA